MTDLARHNHWYSNAGYIMEISNHFLTEFKSTQQNEAHTTIIKPQTYG